MNRLTKLHRTLQRWDVALMLAVLFIGAPSVITYIIQTFGTEFGIPINILLVATSFFLSTFLIWAFCEKDWKEANIEPMVISIGAVCAGFVCTISLLLEIQQIVPTWFFIAVKEVTTFTIITFIAFAFYIKWWGLE